jgi:hypothetical protein
MLGKRFGPTGELGAKGETWVNNFLRGLGYSCIDLSNISNGGAPMLIGIMQNTILPDTLTVKNGDLGFIEIKTKSHPTYWKGTDEWNHGIEDRLWQEYNKIQSETGKTVSIAILQLDPKILLLAKLNSLQKNIRYNNMQDKLHVFFNLMNMKTGESSFDSCYELIGSTPQPIKPLAQRTTNQKYDGLMKLLSLYFNKQLNYINPKTNPNPFS